MIVRLAIRALARGRASPVGYLSVLTHGGDRMSHDGLMVGVSGIRGRVGEALTPEVVAQYAAGVRRLGVEQAAARSKIVVGRDSRVSGPMFHRVVLSALQSVGCDVIDIGLTTTPTCQLAVEHHHAAGGLMISASHNPIEWNALKFIGPTGLFLENAEGIEMRALVETGIPRATWDKLGQIETDDRAVQRHIDRVLAIPYVDVEGIRRRRFHVALDCVRGAGAVIMPRASRAAGLPRDRDQSRDRRPLSAPAGTGRREPRRAGTLVLESGAAIGFAVDPDVDRLALVSDAGKAIGEDFTLALAARLVLRHRTRSGGHESFDEPDRRGCGDRGGSAGDSGAGRRSERRGANARRTGAHRRRREWRRDSVRRFTSVATHRSVPRCCCNCCTRRTSRCRRSWPTCRGT